MEAKFHSSKISPLIMLPFLVSLDLDLYCHIHVKLCMSVILCVSNYMAGNTIQAFTADV